MKNPVILTKKSGAKMAIDASDVKKIIDQEEFRQVFDKKGTCYVVTESFTNICKKCTIKTRKR